MNIHDIELPPLPKGDIAADTCPVMWVHSNEQLQAYTRSAIEPYAKRIAELEEKVEAALQSQCREDAERYRAWRKATATKNGNFIRLVSNELPDWDEGPVDESRIDAAIDYARRIDGDGK